MLNAVFRPVEAWPGQQTPSHKRQRSRFKAAYSKTLDDLERELAAIRAKDVVIQCYLDRDDIRNDGWPRSKARPKQPGVIVTFLQGKDVISMPCDTFLDWEQNVRAIALTLHALRMINQYGVTKRDEQYQGFKRIEAPKPMAQMTIEDAAELVSSIAGVQPARNLIYGGRETFEEIYRLAARKSHPDLNGGSHEMFVRLQQAAELLRRHHGTA
ncbi:MAG: J domain-containing protein [Bryobacteraceae bacterium]